MSSESNFAVKVSSVEKSFLLPHQRASSLKTKALNVKNIFNKKDYEKQKALKEISFEVKKGEFFGIVGRNGSGKSTLLKCIAGVYTPDRGSIDINGTLVPFIELGVGFNPELSGRDNIFLNGSLLGFNREEMEELYDEIVEFSELERFMDQKLKNYSSGMQVRLAFSIAIRAKGEILVLDEVLAVGDSLFQQKCFSYFQNLKRTNQTVLFVSHNAEALRQYCTNGILIEEGKIIESGKIDKVLNKYTDILSDKESKNFEKTVKREEKEKKKKTRHGTGKVIVDEIKTAAKDTKAKRLFKDSDKYVKIVGEYLSKEKVESPIYGIIIRDEAGNRIFSSNNLWQDMKAKDLAKGDKVKVSWTIPNIFNTGTYLISPAVADSSGREVYDSVDDMIAFKVRKQRTNTSLTNLEHKIEMKGA